MTSLWLDRADTVGYPALDGDDRFDYVVVGAGLTGLVTALLLGRSGARVAVVEGRNVGSCATGNTTGKVSLLQGTQLSSIGQRHPPELVADYVAANREGQEWLVRFCEQRTIPFEREAAFTYAQSESGTGLIHAELEACETAGLNAVWQDELHELPFRTHGAVRLDDQVQIDPMDLLRGLAEDATEHGVRIFENTRVRGVTGTSAGHPVFGERVVETDGGSLRAGAVVLATGTPILDRGGFFARLHPNRSYALAFRAPTAHPRGMYIAADNPTRSLRYAPDPDGDLLLVGGNGHTVGRESSAQAKVQDLIDWTQDHFDVGQPTHRWSAQDYTPAHGLPYAGPLLPGSDRILVATGYNKWGMTNAIAAALALTGRLLGGKMPWARALESWSPREILGLRSAAKTNGEVGLAMVSGWLRAEFSGANGPPEEGAGRVERRGIRPVGVCTVDGRTTTVSAVCPHLYGVLRWNDAERSWDCPLHGSRFAADGSILEGPATRALSCLAEQR